MDEIVKNYKVIVVDDSLAYRNSIRSNLKRKKDMNIEVITTENKALGYEAFMDNVDTDLMVIDLDLDQDTSGTAMSNSLGMELIHDVRFKKKKLLLICCTGTGNDDIKKVCEERNIIYVKKYSLISPPRELYSKITVALLSLKK